MVSCQESETESSCDVGKEEDDNEDAASVFEAVIEEDADENGHCDNESVGYLKDYRSSKYLSVAYSAEQKSKSTLTCIRVVTSVEKPNP